MERAKNRTKAKLRSKSRKCVCDDEAEVRVCESALPGHRKKCELDTFSSPV